MVVALGGGLYGFIVPRIAELRPQLEQQVTQALGIPVHIGDINARSGGWVPSFELRDVVLFDAQGNVALRLPRVVASLSLRSLWHLGFEQLYIDEPELNISRAVDGQIFIAGLPLDSDASAGKQAVRARQWVFSQTELVIHNGHLRWTDGMRGNAPLALSGVNVLVRNTARRHALHMDAAVPPAWGSTFSINARFRQPLLSSNTGNWEDWDGQVFANFDRIDVARLRQYVDTSNLGLEVSEGRGAVRLWADLRRGQLTGATADVALTEVSASLGPKLAPLTLRSVSGRLSGKRLPQGFAFATQALQFLTQDGRRWPGGNVAVEWTQADAKNPANGELHADRLDLAALGQMANLIPMNSVTRAALKAHAPQGVVEKLDAHWTDPLVATAEGAWPTTFEAKGRVTDLRIAAGAATEVAPVEGVAQPPKPGTPGIRGATVDFELTQAGGKAQLAVQSGALVFPGVFANPVVLLNQLSAEVTWQHSRENRTDKIGDKLAVQVNRLHFSNTDAEGEAKISWYTSDPTQNASHSQFPGVLDLQGSLSRGNGTQVYRYLPLVLPSVVRDYVHAAVQQGRINGVKFRVKGDLHELPFRDPRQGEFRISADVQDVHFAFVPRTLALAPSPSITKGTALKETTTETSTTRHTSTTSSISTEWPALTQLQGELVFDRNSMQARVASGRVEGLPGLQIGHVDVQIPDLAHSVVHINGEARGPLSEALRLVANTPISVWTGHVLDKTTATGPADYRLLLSLPIKELEKTKVQGAVTLAGNDVQLNPESPILSRSRGVVSFTESGFGLQAVQAGLLGGDTRIEGGTPANANAVLSGAVKGNEPSLSFRAQGTVSAEGLRQASKVGREWGFLSHLANNASGATSYSALLTVRHGHPEVTVQSTLQGMALSLPLPLKKTAEALLPLRFENTLVPASLLPSDRAALQLQDQLLLELGTAGSVGTASYIRDVSGPEPRVLRGSIGVGLTNGETMPMPVAGVAANINLGEVDIGAWEAVLSPAPSAHAPVAANVGEVSDVRALAAESTGLGYLPSVVAIRAKALRLDGHQLQNVVAGGSREGLTWRANLEADELSGYLEYRQSTASSAGRVYARLARLTVEPSTATQVETILDEQPSSIPALDIVVEDLVLRGKKLGRVEIEAVNRGARFMGREPPPPDSSREWRLNKFNVILPEATFSATGNWTAARGGGAALSSPTAPESRRTLMNYRLDIRDAGTLLARFGMKDVVRLGKGRLEGQVSWLGSPLTLDYPSLSGQFNVDVETGQFLKADPGLAKLLGVLSLQSLPRRLALDFRDVFTEGFAFDFVRGDVKIERGIAATNNLQMSGVNAAVLMEGSANISKETQDLKVVVVPEINAGTASLVASVINPLVGLTTFLTQFVLRRPLMEAATQEFRIDGSWADPKIVKVDRKQRAPSPAAGAQSPLQP